MNNYISRRGMLQWAPALAAAPVVEASPLTPAEGSKETDIFRAAFEGDAARVAELAKWNPAVARLRSPEGKTPLHYAVAGGRADMIFTLSQLGADLSAGPESPLLGAVDYSEHATATAMAQALLMNASDPNAKRADGRTALELAAARGYRDIVETLVHRGAEGPQAAGVKVERVYFGKRFAFDVKGQPYTPEDISGLPQDFINECTRQAHSNGALVVHLVKIAPGLVAAKATWDEMPIEAAAHMGLRRLVQHLADLGAPVSLCSATLLGLKERVEAMVKSDAACVRERGAHDIAVLAYTTFSDQQAEIANVLLEAGANVHAKALGGMTTLHLAAGKGYVELAEVLLAHGADVNAAAVLKGEDVTPLALAVKAKRDRMVEFLKGKGGKG